LHAPRSVAGLRRRCFPQNCRKTFAAEGRTIVTKIPGTERHAVIRISEIHTLFPDLQGKTFPKPPSLSVAGSSPYRMQHPTAAETRTFSIRKPLSVLRPERKK